MIDFTATFLARHGHFVRTATEILGTEEEAEDAVQDSWCYAWEHRERVESPGYVKRAVQHRAIDYLRRRRPELFEDLTQRDEYGQEYAVHPALVDGRTERDLMNREQVRQLLRRSGPTVRRYLAEYYLEDATAAELATRYHSTVISVMSQIQRAKQKLRRRYPATV